MSNSARNLKISDTLKDGMMVTVRAVRPDDKQRINEAFHNLDPETIYTRYFQHKKDLSDQDLKWATELDFENDVALVVTIEQEGREIIIGGSRYSLLQDAPGAAPRAEIAFTVEEDFQGKGMAKLLLHHMADIARAQGIRNFEAEVLPENTSMLMVFQKSGFAVKRRHEDGSIHVSLTF